MAEVTRSYRKNVKTVNLTTKHKTNNISQIHIHALQWKPQSTFEPTRLTSMWLCIINTYGSAGEELRKRELRERSHREKKKQMGKIVSNERGVPNFSYELDKKFWRFPNEFAMIRTRYRLKIVKVGN